MLNIVDPPGMGVTLINNAQKLTEKRNNIQKLEAFHALKFRDILQYRGHCFQIYLPKEM